MSAPRKALLFLGEKSVEKLCTTTPTFKRAHKKRRTIDVVDTTDEERRRAVRSLIVLERSKKERKNESPLVREHLKTWHTT